jgi:hypothetical protein
MKKGSGIQGGKKHWISDPDPQHWNKCNLKEFCIQLPAVIIVYGCSRVQKNLIYSTGTGTQYR